MPVSGSTVTGAAMHSPSESTTPDRWVAATALRLQIPIVSNDDIFSDVPGLTVERIDP